jgi:succinyl-CoA synthetase alpha subunit
MAALYTKDTQAIFWNNNKSAIQRMLDYDYTISREKPSVAAIVAPTSSNKFEKFFYGPDEVMVPIFKCTADAAEAFPKADVLLNFASFRTAYDVTMEAIAIKGQFSSIMVTAEGIPERLARGMNQAARDAGVTVIGPATVGGIAPGAFKIANVGGTIENIVNSKLHRAGSCGLVTRSGGLFNELSNIISINADGIAEGVAIGGDRFVGSVFIDNLLRMESNPEVKYMILLGEVGGTEEYKVIEAVKNGQIKKNRSSHGVSVRSLSTSQQVFSSVTQVLLQMLTLKRLLQKMLQWLKQVFTYLHHSMTYRLQFKKCLVSLKQTELSRIFQSQNLRSYQKYVKPKNLSVLYLMIQVKKLRMLVTRSLQLRLQIQVLVSVMLFHFYGSKNVIRLGQLNLLKQ